MGVLVGKKAPDFSTKAIVNGSEIKELALHHFIGKTVVLFFYPLDFTFVCPTELHAFQDKLEAFEKRGVSLIGCSVDSIYSHLAWLNTPKTKGGIQGITYPLLADLNKEIAKLYDVLADDGVAFRGLFLIDSKGIVRHQVVNDLPLGRSVDEVLRMIDALSFFENEGEVCPANWNKGQKGMKPTTDGLLTYLS